MTISPRLSLWAFIVAAAALPAPLRAADAPTVLFEEKFTDKLDANWVWQREDATAWRDELCADLPAANSARARTSSPQCECATDKYDFSASLACFVATATLARNVSISQASGSLAAASNAGKLVSSVRRARAGAEVGGDQAAGGF